MLFAVFARTEKTNCQLLCTLLSHSCTNVSNVELNEWYINRFSRFTNGRKWFEPKHTEYGYGSGGYKRIRAFRTMAFESSLVLCAFGEKLMRLARNDAENVQHINDSYRLNE